MAHLKVIKTKKKKKKSKTLKIIVDIYNYLFSSKIYHIILLQLTWQKFAFRYTVITKQLCNNSYNIQHTLYSVYLFTKLSFY